MRRDELVRLVEAASRVTGGSDIVVVGSAALLAVVEEPTGALAVGHEADLVAIDHPDRGSAIDAALGPDTMYHDAQGTCARGTGPMTPLAPAAWIERLVALDASATRARCMEAHDLVLAKLAVGRGKDYDFCAAAVDAGLVLLDELEVRIADMPMDEFAREELRRTLARVTGTA